MTRFLTATSLVLNGEPPNPDRRKLDHRDLRPWPASEEHGRPEGRGLWSVGLDLGQLNTLKAIPQEEEEPEDGGSFVYRRFRVYDGEDNLIAEGDGIFHTGAAASWETPLEYAAQTWNAADIRFFETGYRDTDGAWVPYERGEEWVSHR